jgi:hypothetical protein
MSSRDEVRDFDSIAQTIHESYFDLTALSLAGRHLLLQCWVEGPDKVQWKRHGLFARAAKVPLLLHEVHVENVDDLSIDDRANVGIYWIRSLELGSDRSHVTIYSELCNRTALHT